MTAEEFQRLVNNCQPSELYNPDWSIYTPLGFANDLLPSTKIRMAESMKVYDGAELFSDTHKTERKLYFLTDNKFPISLIGFTYPKGVEAEKQRKNVIVSDTEVCVFIEVAQNDSIEVFFKLGRNFKEFLHSYSRQSKKTFSPTVVETATYRTDIKKLKAVFDKKLVHYNLMEFVLKTIGIDETKTFQNNYESKLQNLLAANKMEGFVYANVFLKNGKKQYVSIAVKQGTQGLNYSINITDKKPDGHQPEKFIAVKKSAITLPLMFVTDAAKPLVESPVIQSENGKPQLNNEILKQVYTELNKAGFSENPTQKPKNDFDLVEIGETLANQLSNPFYKDVKVLVRVSRLGETEAPKPTTILKTVDGIIMPSQQTISPPSPQIIDTLIVGDPNVYDVAIDIIVDEKGNIIVKHHAHENYLKEYVDKWQQEAKARGLDINIEDLRQKVLADFESIETEKGFYDKFIQGVKSTFNNKIAGYVEGVQATQKVARNVWKDGEINKSLWHSKEEEHQQWPSYMETHPVTGGITDGVVDEIVGIPMAIKTVYEIATDEEKRKAFANVFTKEGLKQLADGFTQEAKDTYNDDEKLGHFSAKTTVSVVSMMSGAGFFAKAGKADDLLEIANKTAKKLDEIPDGKFMELSDLLKKSKRTVAEERLMREIVAEVGEDVLREASDELFDLYKLAAKNNRKFSWEEVKAFFKRGNDFNEKSKKLDWYKNNEIWLTHPTEVYPKGHKLANQPKRYRLDSWDEAGDGMIVSRKATDLDKIQQSTFEKYCKEINDKYPPGSKIANEDIGDKLYGKYYLELPESNKSFERIDEYITIAKDKYEVEIIFKPE